MPTHNHTHQASRSASSQSLFLVALSADQEQGGGWNQLFPDGDFVAIDGRGPFLMNRKIAEALIAMMSGAKNDLAVDYEHQTLRSEKNGQPAPAAGWIRTYEWRDGEGLFAQIKWTPAALAAIKGDEYKYLSPMFVTDKTGRIPLRLLPAALVNYPAIDGMQAVVANSGLIQQKDKAMDELLKALRAYFKLPEESTPEQILEAWNKGQAEKEKGDAKSSTEAMSAIVVQRDEIAKLRSDLVALRAQLNASGTDAQITAALADGRLLAGLEAWARDLGKTNPQALSAYLAGAQPIAALSGMQSATSQQQQQKVALSADELAVSQAFGMSVADFAAAKQAMGGN
ncbi:hypothetical protein HC761_00510 [bacterium]|nr:hypothetical protein [bacterium]